MTRKTSGGTNLGLMLRFIIALAAVNTCAKSDDGDPGFIPGNKLPGMELTPYKAQPGGKFFFYPLSCFKGDSEDECLAELSALKEYKEKVFPGDFKKILAQRESAKKFVKDIRDKLLEEVKDVDLTDAQKEIYNKAVNGLISYLYSLALLKEADESGLGNCGEFSLHAGFRSWAKHGKESVKNAELITMIDPGADDLFHQFFLQPDPKSRGTEAVEVKWDGDVDSSTMLASLNGIIIDPWNNLKMTAAEAREHNPMLYLARGFKLRREPFPGHDRGGVNKLPAAIRRKLKACYLAADGAMHALFFPYADEGKPAASKGGAKGSGLSKASLFVRKCEALKHFKRAPMPQKPSKQSFGSGR